MKRILLTILALLPLALHAQDTLYNSYNESVYVQGDFRPTIEQSFKLHFNPSIVDTTETMQHTFTYGITPQRVTSVFSPARLGYVKISEPPQRLYNNYIRLGMGNYWTPMADLYYHSTRSKTLNYGARLYHKSSWGKIGRPADPDSLPSADYYGKNHFSNTQLDLFAKYILKEKHQFSADLNYENDYNMFYGFSDSVLNEHTWMVHDSMPGNVDKRSLGMMYNLVDFRLGAKSLHTDLNKFGYDATASLNQLWGRYGMSETHYALDGTLHYGFPFLKSNKGIAYLRLGYEGWQSSFAFRMLDDWEPDLPFLVNDSPLVGGPITWPFDSTYTSSRFIFQTNPYIDFIFRQFQVHAGANLAFDKFSDPEAANFLIFPDVVISTKMMSDALSINAGFTGGIEANDWNAIRMVNPYVMPAAGERATRHWDLYGHMRLTFSKKLELNARAQFSYLKDDLNFNSDVVYDLWGGDCKFSFPFHNLFATDYVSYSRATVGADLTFVNDEMLSATLAGHYYGYISDQQLYYRPNWDASLKVSMNYKDKVRVHLQGLLMGKMASHTEEEVNYDPEFPWASHYSDVVQYLPMRTGLNLEVEYLHTRALSFFAKFDNILCQRYFYWANYPSQRLQVMLGLTYTVPHK